MLFRCQFEGTKRVIRGRKVKKVQNKKFKETTMFYKTLHKKLKIGQHEPY
jgi:hypothetical protein